MKIALAQIDCRLGDIERICSRIESQASLAHDQGARVLCVPAPLLGGTAPGTLAESADYIHDVLTALTDLSAHCARLGVVALVPAIVSHEGAPILEIFMLKKGRVIPVRTLLALRRAQAQEELWQPPVFDVDGVRLAVTFDAHRDFEELPQGVDALIYFQMDALNLADESTAAVAAVADGHFREQVARRSLWFACMAPVGGFDDAVFCGGSFVMDDGGRVVACAPCFEEALLVQEISRGVAVPCMEDHELPHFERNEWLWEALRLGLADAVAAQARGRAALVLSGDLPSSLLAALAVDALGPRNVVGLYVARQRIATPAQEAAEEARAARVRELARHLGIRLVERTEPDQGLVLDADGAVTARAGRAAGIERLLLADLAHAEAAVPLSSTTKTHAALAPSMAEGALAGQIAPFGDVYLTALEFLARSRNRAGEVVRAELVSLKAVASTMGDIVAHAVWAERADAAYAGKMASLLAELEPSQIDGVLEAHVDRGLSLDELPLAASAPEACALLLMIVRQGETARRALPMSFSVSARTFEERAWPRGLAWSDLGLRDAERLTLADVAQREIERAESRGAEMGERMRGELMGLISGLLGISPEQLEELGSEEGQRRLGEGIARFESQMREAFEQMAEREGPDAEGGRPGQAGGAPGMRGLPFFSLN